MRLDRTFPLEDPAVEIPWRVSEAGFRMLVGGERLEQVVAGRLRQRCRLLGGLDADLTFHFSPIAGGQLREIELLRHPKRHREREFDDLQQRLERMLGPGERLEPRLGLHPAGARWQLGALRVTHEYYTAAGKDHEKVRFIHD
ncbi:MAG TPA: hypothetical protein VGH98_19550 [Gemmatimonadaceae bacterium]|jgi:hypothetical protein